MKSMLCAALLGVCWGMAGPARADTFMLVIQEAPAEFAKRDRQSADGQAYWTAYAEYGRALQTAGILRGGSPVGAALGTVRMAKGAVRAGAAERTDGLVLGGFFLIDVPDAATANVWAARAPAATTGRVDVHAVPASPAMAK
jgi:hypothetical protein